MSHHRLIRSLVQKVRSLKFNLEKQRQYRETAEAEARRLRNMAVEQIAAEEVARLQAEIEDLQEEGYRLSEAAEMEGHRARRAAQQAEDDARRAAYEAEDRRDQVSRATKDLERAQQYGNEYETRRAIERLRRASDW